MANQQMVPCMECGRPFHIIHVKKSVCVMCRLSKFSSAILSKSPCPCGEQRDTLDCEYEVLLDTIKDLRKKLALSEERNQKDHEFFVREIVTAKTMM